MSRNPKDVHVSVRIPAAVAAELAAEAKRRDLPVSYIIRERVGANAAYIMTNIVQGEDDGQGAPAGPVDKVADEPSSPCAHPKNRLVYIAKGKRCLDCDRTFV